MPNLSLVNVKLDRKELTERAEPSKVDQPVYPYGLRVQLDEDTIDKLGIRTLPEVGEPLILVARVNVISVSENQHVEGKDGKPHRHRNVELQITDLALGPNEDEKKPKAQDVLYRS